MYEIESLIENPELIEHYRDTFENKNLNYFIPLFDESIRVIFGEDDFNSEMLNDFNNFLVELLNEEYSTYRQDSICDFTQFNTKERHRDLDKIINEYQPAVDSPLLGVLTLRLCLKVLTCIEIDNINNNTLMSLFGEISEAMALSRISSSYVNYREEYEYELTKEEVSRRTKKRNASQKNVQKKITQDKIKSAEFQIEVNKLCTAIWDIEPYIPHGLLVDILHSKIALNLRGIRDRGMKIKKPSTIKKYLSENQIPPKTAIYKGRAPHKVNNSRFDRVEYKEIIYILIDEYKEVCQLPID